LQEFFGQPWVDGWILNIKGDWTCWFCQIDIDLSLPITSNYDGYKIPRAHE
jgi:hypothetical protein